MAADLSSATAPVRFDIEAQSLAAALNELALQAHTQILFTPEVVKGRLTKGFNGDQTVDEVLAHLLIGTGLAWSRSGDGVILVTNPVDPPAARKGVADSSARPLTNAQGESSMPRRNMLSRFWGALIGCGVVAYGGAACAQNAAPAALPAVSGQLEEIVVTAEKREEDPQKVAVALQVFSGEQLKIEGKKRIDDILDTVPGVQVQDGGRGPTFAFRGVDSGMTGRVQTGATVAVLFDGIFQDRPEGIRGATLDVARTEVMWGTQSTTLGPSSIAGAISIVTNQPAFDSYQATGSVGVGNYNSVDTEGVMNLPVTDNQALRVAYSTSRRDGYYSSNAGNENNLTARLRYRFKPSDNLDMTFTLQHQKIGGNGLTAQTLPYAGHWEGYNPALDGNYSVGTCNIIGPTAPANPNPNLPNCYSTTMGGPSPILGLVGGMLNGNVGNTVQYGPDFRHVSDPWNTGQPKNLYPNGPYTDTNFTQYSAELNWKTALGTVTVLPSFQSVHHYAISAAAGAGTSYNIQKAPTTSTQFEARIASNPGSSIQWLGGVYYYYTPFQENSCCGNDGTVDSVNLPNDGGPGNYTCPYDPSQLDPLTGTPINGRQDATGGYLPNNSCYIWSSQKINSLRTESVFGNVIVPFFSDRLRLIGGLRYSRDHRELQSNNQQVAFGNQGGDLGTITGPGVPFQYGVVHKGDWSAVTYRAGIEYDLGPQQLLYATYATGYQPGALDGNAGPTDPPIPKNINDQFTVGFKSRFFDQRLQFNIEAFMLNYKDRFFNDVYSVGIYPFRGLNGPQFACCNIPTRSYITTDPTTSYLNSLDPNYNVIDNQPSRGADIDVAFLPTAADRINASVELLDSYYGGNPRVRQFTVAEALAANYNPNAASEDQTALNAAAAAVVAKYNYLVTHYKGVVLQTAPRYTATLSYQHRFTLGNGSTLTPQISADFKGKYWAQGDGGSVGSWGAFNAFDAGSPLKQDPYHMLNAQMSWDSPDHKYTISAFGRNLQNTVAMTNVGANFSNQLVYVSIEPPRVFGVTVQASL